MNAFENFCYGLASGLFALMVFTVGFFGMVWASFHVGLWFYPDNIQRAQTIGTFVAFGFVILASLLCGAAATIWRKVKGQ